MIELMCYDCKRTLPIDDFTKFDRNPSLADREGRVIYCRDCINKMVEENGNNKEALKMVLRKVDIPYVEKFANTAIKSFKKKMENTAVVTTINRFTGETMKVEEENLKIQTSLFNCYASKIGLMPKNLTCWTATQEDDNVEAEISKKDIATSKRYISRQFGNESLKNSTELSKLVLNELKELVKRKNKTNEQKKNRLIGHIKTLISANLVEDSDFNYLDSYEKMEVGESVFTFDENVNYTNSKESQGQEDDLISEYESFRNKWSDAYRKSDVIKYERQYRKLKKDYIIKTAQHEMYLRKVCVVMVKLDEALSTGNTDEAKIYSQMFKDFCQQGNLTPTQMAKEESEGISCFGEWYKQMENDCGVIGVVRALKKQPIDDADMVIFAVIQYIRRLTGRGDIKYEEIYNFYDELAKSYDEELTIEDDDDFLNGGDGDDVSEDGEYDE